MTRPPRLALALLAAAALVVGAAACGSSGKKAATTTQQTHTAAEASQSSAATFAGGVCGAISGWKTGVTQAVSALKQNPSKAGLQQALADVQTATQTLTSSLKGLQAPQLQSVQSVKQTLTTLEKQLKDGTASMSNEIHGSNATLAKVSSVTGTLATMRTQVKQATTSLRSVSTGELHDAFQTAPACTSLEKAA